MSRRRRKRARPAPPPPPDEAASARIWDLPTRLSHWAIASLFLFQFLTGRYDLLAPAAHLWAGYLLIAALLFRLQWGLVGPEPSRFSHFIAGPGAVWRYLRGMWTRKPSHWPGHNPLGGWSSALMLALLTIQAVTGLFIETWADLRGPLAERVTRDTAILMADIHAVVQWPLLALILLHVLAALLYLAVKREDRIGPIFVSGRLAVEPGTPDIAPASAWRAWLVLAVSVTVTVLVAWLGPID
jgi:cytochrome b